MSGILRKNDVMLHETMHDHDRDVSSSKIPTSVAELSARGKKAHSFY